MASLRRAGIQLEARGAAAYISQISKAQSATKSLQDVFRQGANLNLRIGGSGGLLGDASKQFQKETATLRSSIIKALQSIALPAGLLRGPAQRLARGLSSSLRSAFRRLDLSSIGKTIGSAISSGLSSVRYSIPSSIFSPLNKIGSGIISRIGSLKSSVGAAFGNLFNNALTLASFQIGGAALEAISNTILAPIRAVTSSVQEAITLEQGIADIEGSAALRSSGRGVDPQELAALRSTVIELATDPNLVIGFEGANEAALTLLRNGNNLSDINDGLLRETILLSNAIDSDLVTSSEVVSRVSKIFDLQDGDVDNTSGQIAAVIQGSGFRSSNDYRYSLLQAGQEANTLGIDFNDFNEILLATGGFFSSGRTSGTAFRNFLLNLSPSTDKAREAMAELGLEFFDAEGQFVGTANTIKELNRVFASDDGFLTTVQKGGLTGDQADELGALESTIKRLKQSVNALTFEYDGADLSEEERAKKIAGTNKQLQAATARYAELAGVTGSYTDILRTLSQEEKLAYLETIFGREGAKFALIVSEITEQQAAANEEIISTASAADSAALRTRTLGQAWENFGDVLGGIGADAAFPLLAPLQDAVRVVTDIASSFAPLANSIGARLADSLGAPLTAITAIRDALDSGLSPLEILSRGLGRLGESINLGPFQGLLDIISSIAGVVIAGPFSSVLEQLGIKAASSLGRDADPESEAPRPEIGSPFAQFSNTPAGKFLSPITDALGGAAEDLLGVTSELREVSSQEFASAATGNLGATIAKVLRDPGTLFGGRFETSESSRIGGKTGDAGLDVDAILSAGDVVITFVSGLGSVIGAVAQTVNDVSGAFTSLQEEGAIASALEPITTLISEIGTGLSGADSEGVGQSISDVFVSIRDLYSNVIDIGTQNIDGVTGSLNTLLGGILDFATGVTTGFDAGAVSTAIVGFGQSIVDIADAFVGGIDAEGAAEGAGGLIRVLTDRLSEALAPENLSGLGESIGSLGTTITTQLSNLFSTESFGTDIGASLGNIGTAIANGISGIGELLLGIGDEFDADSVGGQLKAAIQSFLGNIVAGFTSELTADGIIPAETFAQIEGQLQAFGDLFVLPDSSGPESTIFGSISDTIDNFNGLFEEAEAGDTGTLSTAIGFITDGIDSVTNAIRGFGSVSGEGASNVEGVQDTIASIFDLIETFNALATQGIVKGISSVSGLIDGIIDLGTAFATTGAEGDGVDFDGSEKIANAASGLLGTIIDRFSAVLTAADLPEITASIGDFVAALTGSLVSALTGAGEGGSDFSEAGGNITGALGNLASTIISELVSTFSNERFVSGFQSAFSNLGIAIFGGLNKAISGEAGDTSSVTESFTGLATTIGTRITSALSGVAFSGDEEISGNIQSFFTGLLTQISTAVEDADVSSYAAIATGFLRNLSESFASAFSSGGEEAESTEIGEAAKGLGGAIIGQLASVLSNPDVGSDIGAGVTAIITGILSQLATEVQSVGDAIASVATGSGDSQLGNAFSAFVENFISGVSAQMANADYSAIGASIIDGIGKAILGLELIIANIGDSLATALENQLIKGLEDVPLVGGLLSEGIQSNQDGRKQRLDDLSVSLDENGIGAAGDFLDELVPALGLYRDFSQQQNDAVRENGEMMARMMGISVDREAESETIAQALIGPLPNTNARNLTQEDQSRSDAIAQSPEGSMTSFGQTALDAVQEEFSETARQSEDGLQQIRDGLSAIGNFLAEPFRPGVAAASSLYPEIDPRLAAVTTGAGLGQNRPEELIDPWLQTIDRLNDSLAGAPSLNEDIASIVTGAGLGQNQQDETSDAFYQSAKFLEETTFRQARAQRAAASLSRSSAAAGGANIVTGAVGAGASSGAAGIAAISSSAGEFSASLVSNAAAQTAAGEQVAGSSDDASGGLNDVAGSASAASSALGGLPATLSAAIGTGVSAITGSLISGGAAIAAAANSAAANIANSGNSGGGGGGGGGDDGGGGSDLPPSGGGGTGPFAAGLRAGQSGRRGYLTALASGASNFPGGDALMGEIGPELAVDVNSKRVALFGRGGPEMARLPQGTIVFPHDKTASILGGQSRSFASAMLGNALANGSLFSTADFEPLPTDFFGPGTSAEEALTTSRDNDQAGNDTLAGSESLLNPAFTARLLEQAGGTASGLPDLASLTSQFNPNISGGFSGVARGIRGRLMGQGVNAPNTTINITNNIDSSTNVTNNNNQRYDMAYKTTRSQESLGSDIRLLQSQFA